MFIVFVAAIGGMANMLEDRERDRERQELLDDLDLDRFTTTSAPLTIDPPDTPAAGPTPTIPVADAAARQQYRDLLAGAIDLDVAVADRAACSDVVNAVASVDDELASLDIPGEVIDATSDELTTFREPAWACLTGSVRPVDAAAELLIAQDRLAAHVAAVAG